MGHFISDISDKTDVVKAQATGDGACSQFKIFSDTCLKTLCRKNPSGPGSWGLPISDIRHPLRGDNKLTFIPLGGGGDKTNRFQNGNRFRWILKKFRYNRNYNSLTKCRVI